VFLLETQLHLFQNEFILKRQPFNALGQHTFFLILYYMDGITGGLYKNDDWRKVAKGILKIITGSNKSFTTVVA